MSYTVGIKRKLWFGYRKLEVNGHDWQNGRFILNLVDGSQEHVPAYAIPVLKVYPNFWNHIEMTRRMAPVRQGATTYEPAPVRQAEPEVRQAEPEQVRQEPEPIREPVKPDPFEQTVMNNARQHVERIFSEQHRPS